MNPASLSALATLSGSAVSGLTSFLSSWLGQSAHLRSQVFLNDKSRGQELYREFVDGSFEGIYLRVNQRGGVENPPLQKVIARN